MNKQEAIKLLICEKVCVEDVDGNVGGEKVRQAYDMAIEALSAERTGEWIEHDPKTKRLAKIYECPFCGDEVIGEETNFCPNCGADMRGDE